MKMLLIFSLQLTEEKQKSDVLNHLNINEFIYLTKKLQQLWSSINPNEAFQEE